jgi:hypothetical protein
MAENVITEEDGKPQDEELVVVEQPPQAVEDDDDEDERVAKTADEPEGANEQERDAIRERRRLEKLERKDRRDKAIQRDKLELDFLRKQNEQLERRLQGIEQRTHQMDLSGIDAQIGKAASEIDMAEKVIAKAIEAGNGEDVSQALKYRDAARERLAQLNYSKQQTLQRPPAQQNAAIDDRTMMHAQRFLDENKWYDPQGRDEQSAIVLAIDAALVRDGYDPKAPEYWDELRTRAARRLPERFGKSASKEQPDADDASVRKPRGGPAIGSGREHAPPTTRREIYISPERKQALIEAGVWDDPILRAKYVKRYAEYDRTNRS